MFEYLDKNSLYLVLIIVLVVWFGIYGYLFRIDSRIRKLERESGK